MVKTPHCHCRRHQFNPILSEVRSHTLCSRRKKKKKNLPKEKVTFLSCNLLIYKTVAVETCNPLLAYQFWSKQILIDNLEFCWTMQLHILLDQSHNQPYLSLWSSPSIIIIITSTYDIFPVVMYGYKSWTIKKTEHWRIGAFELWCGEDSWELFGLQGDPSSPSYRRSVLSVHWKDWCWIWNSYTLATWCKWVSYLHQVAKV